MRKRPKHRPDFMKHFPPLDAKVNEISQNPKIISRGSLTQATPVSEIKFYRQVSDIIGNKYTPKAKNLNIKSFNGFPKKGIYRSII